MKSCTCRYFFSNLVVIKTLNLNHRMHNLYAKFAKILEICKQFSENLVNESGDSNLRTRIQCNDRRKKTTALCEELRKRIAMEIDDGEEQFFVCSTPIEACRVARGRRCKMGCADDFCNT